MNSKTSKTQKSKRKTIKVKTIRKANNVRKIQNAMKQKDNIAQKSTLISSVCTPYLESLLYPEVSTQAKIPGMADQTVSLHRKVTVMSNANALGAFGLIAQPTFLSDAATNTSCISVNNQPTYDGFTAGTGGNAVRLSCPFNIPANTVSTYRLVSFSVVVTPQLSNLNLQGTLHGALIKTDGDVPGVVGGNSSITGLAVPNISSAPTYCEANVNTGNGLRIVWCPNDIHLLQFKAINTNWQTNEHTLNEFVPMIVGVGLPANAPMRIDLFFNFEVTPYISNNSISILSGMESVCPHNGTPSAVWRSFFTSYSTKIATPYLGHNHDYNQLRLANLSIVDKVEKKPEAKGVFQDRIYQLMNSANIYDV